MRILICVELILQNRRNCDGAAELWAVPTPVLSLLNLRLGCRLAEVLCCSVVCSLVTSCVLLAAPSANLLIGDSRAVAVGAGRCVMLSCERNLELRLVQLQCIQSGAGANFGCSFSMVRIARSGLEAEVSYCSAQ